MRNVIYQREPYYISHSKLPRVKYAVNDASLKTRYFHSDMEFEIEFTVYKGYSESLLYTNEVDSLEDGFMLTETLPTDYVPRYQFNTNNFTVYNGSPSNFYLTNLNNQSKFTKPLKLLIL